MRPRASISEFQATTEPRSYSFSCSEQIGLGQWAAQPTAEARQPGPPLPIRVRARRGPSPLGSGYTPFYPTAASTPPAAQTDLLGAREGI